MYSSLNVASLSQYLKTPKLGKASGFGRLGWYKFYAGFSGTFVEEALLSIANGKPARVLDPWNGSGTTSQTAFRLGHQALGYDLNPVMVIVARAKTIDAAVAPKIDGLLADILAEANEQEPMPYPEPFAQWFTTATCFSFRRLERAINCLLVNRNNPLYVAELADLNLISSLAAFFYVAMFHAVRNAIAPFRSSNPTWIKHASAESEKISLHKSDVFSAFWRAASRMRDDLDSEVKSLGSLGRAPCSPILNIASSGSLPVENESIDLVITSPPYCTRIDYVVKTAPELAVLGASHDRIRALRDAMIGTATISTPLPEQCDDWGTTCRRLLDEVQKHQSRAAKSYYWKTLIQYFNGIANSIKELDRILRPGGNCLIVVQDSYFT
jgi:hypothetical protein